MQGHLLGENEKEGFMNLANPFLERLPSVQPIISAPQNIC